MSGYSKKVLAVLLFGALAASSLGGCAWWEKNVAKKVKNFRQHRLTIFSDPPGSDVYVNDVYQGRTPLTLNFKIELRDVAKGLDIVIEREGYLPVRRQVTFRTQKVAFRLIRR